MRAFGVLFVVAASVGLAAQGGPALSAQLADAFDKKLTDVRLGKPADPKGRTTRFLETELNSFLKFKGAGILPVGLTDPVFTLQAGSRVTARAVVDLDVIRQKKSSGGWFDPTSYITGKIPLTATGTLSTGDGLGRVEIERIEMSGVPVPRTLLQQILTFYTTSPEHPDGTRLDDTYELPANIRRVDVAPGRFTVVQ